MWLLLLAILGATALDQQPPHLRSVQLLQPGFEHRFRYEGTTFSGIPLPAESSATLSTVYARVQYFENKTALLQFETLNLTSGWSEPKHARFEDLESRTVHMKHQHLLALPVYFHYKNGIVSALMFHKHDKPWSENIKRAFISLLQVNTHTSLQDGQQFETPVPQLETTLEGFCQPVYTVTTLPNNIHVTKSINIGNCKHSPIVLYNSLYSSKCRECRESTDVESESVLNYIIDNKTGILSVDGHAFYIYSVSGNQSLRTTVNLRITRESLEQIRNPIASPNGTIQDLIFSTRDQELIEKFFKNGEISNDPPFDEFPNKLLLIKLSIEELKGIEDSKPEHTEALSQLIRYLRMCSKKELELILSDVYTKVDEEQQALLLNALAIAGTKNTIEQVIYQIEKRIVSITRSIQLLKSVQETPYPSAEIADLLIRFAKSSTAANSEPIRQSIWLAAGTIVRGVVSIPSIKKKTHFVNENNIHNKEKYTGHFVKQIEESKDIYEKIVAIKALANAGIDLSVHKLEKIIYNKNEETIVRVEAVDALRLLKDIMPRKIQLVLLPIYNNRFEKPELRMAALVQIIDSLPAKHVIAQIATNVDREPSRHVAEFTYHVLQQLSQSSNPCHKRIASETQTVLRMIRYKPTEGVLSVMKKLPLFSEEGMTGIDFNLATIFGSDSYLPKELSASFETLIGGNWNKYLAQVGIRQQNVDRMLRRLVEKIGRKQESEVSRASRNNMAVQLLSKVSQELSISRRRNSDKYSQTVIYLRYKDMDFAVLPVDEKMVKRFIEKFISSGEFDPFSLAAEVEFSVAQAFLISEFTLKLPSISGFLLTISNDIPTFASLSAHLSIDHSKDNSTRAHLQAITTITSTSTLSMVSSSPVFEQGSKLIQYFGMNFPVDLHSEFANQENARKIYFSMKMPQQKRRFIESYSRPTSFVRQFHLNRTVLEEREETIRSPVFEGSSIEFRTEYVIVGLKTVARGYKARESSSINAMFLEQNFDFHVQPMPEAAKELTALIVVESIQKTTMEMEPIDYTFEDEKGVQNQGYESVEENVRRLHYQRSSSKLRGKDGYKQRTTLRLGAPDAVDLFAGVEVVTQCNTEFRHWKFEVNARRIPLEQEKTEWAVKAIVEIVLPKQLSSLKQLQEHRHRQLKTYVFARWGSDLKNEVVAKLHMHYSKQQSQLLKHIGNDLHAKLEPELLARISPFNQINVVADYRLTPYSEHSFNRFYDILKGFTFMDSEIVRSTNKKCLFVAEITFEPLNSRLVNVSMQTPEERFIVEQLILPYRIPLPSFSSFSIDNFVPWRQNLSPAECTVKSSQISTFDEIVLRAPLTTCYSVIAKDCSEEPRFDVRIKKVNNDSDEKMMMVITKFNVYELHLVDGLLQVSLDGQNLRPEQYEKNSVFLSEKHFRVELEDVKVHFDGYVATVQMNPLMQGRQCGLCGHYDGDSTNELRNARNEEAKDIESFQRSYIVRNSCDLAQEEVLLSDKTNYGVVTTGAQLEENWSDDGSENGTQPKNKEKHERDPNKKVRVEEHSHRVCFSKSLVSECKENEKMQRKSRQKVEFVCLPRHDYETFQLLRRIRQGDEASFNGHKHSYVRILNVPQACVVF